MSHRYLPSRSRLSRRLSRRDQSGAALLEFVLVAIPFFFILYGLIAFGMMLALKQGITNASAEAARSAVGCSSSNPGCTDPVAKATATVDSRLSWLSANAKAGVTKTATVASCTGGSGTCITVTVTYDYAHHALIPPAPGLGLFTPSTFHSTATVQIS